MPLKQFISRAAKVDFSYFLGESEVTLEFSESLLASTILSKIEAIHLLYTVQIVPRTDMVSHFTDLFLSHLVLFLILIATSSYPLHCHL